MAYDLETDPKVARTVFTVYALWLSTYVKKQTAAQQVTVEECEQNMAGMIQCISNDYSLSAFLKGSLGLEVHPLPSDAKARLLRLLEDTWHAFPEWLHDTGRHIAGFAHRMPLELVYSPTGDLTHIKNVALVTPTWPL